MLTRSTAYSNRVSIVRKRKLMKSNNRFMRAHITWSLCWSMILSNPDIKDLVFGNVLRRPIHTSNSSEGPVLSISVRELMSSKLLKTSARAKFTLLSKKVSTNLTFILIRRMKISTRTTIPSSSSAISLAMWRSTKDLVFTASFTQRLMKGIMRTRILVSLESYQNKVNTR